MSVEDNLVLKEVGKIWMPKKTMRGGARVYLPSSVVLDSQFPFYEDSQIIVEIDIENGVVKLIPINKTD